MNITMLSNSPASTHCPPPAPPRRQKPLDTDASCLNMYLQHSAIELHNDEKNEEPGQWGIVDVTVKFTMLGNLLAIALGLLDAARALGEIVKEDDFRRSAMVAFELDPAAMEGCAWE